jgi:HSP20 family protein
MEETKGFWSPVIDIEEDNDNFIVKTELPGVTKKNIKISVRGNLLTITGHRKQESEVKNKTFHRIERSYGKFMRTITLPSEVNADDVKAKCKNGILTITLPKPESMKPKEITVELS